MSTRPRREVPQGVEAVPLRRMSEPDLDAFYRRVFLPLVRRATWKHHMSKEDARDIVQDAFLLAIAKLDSTKNPKAWLIQVVDHLSLNHQRKNARRAQLAAKWGLAGQVERRLLESRRKPEC
jgi:DNA-directed RNA polymerase specialized sigma24 family protein